jgi:thioredoxin 1
MFSFCKYLVVGAALFSGSLSAAVVTVNSENFKTEVLDSKIPVILDAYTDWCHYCKSVAPVFAELSNEMEGRVKFVKLNIEAEHSVAGGLNIEALPTFLFYKNGKVVDRQAGALDKNEFKAKFAKYFGS